MQVMQGFSGEVKPSQWAKVDVTLTETDIMRVLIGAGIEIAPEKVPLAIAWQILDAEAERFILVKLIRKYGYQVDEGKARLVELAQTIQDLIAKVRALADG